MDYARPRRVLKETFGHDAFRPGQEGVIGAVLARRDCIAVMPTGAGKSVLFQIPAKILSGTVVVVSPLISLMKDQVDGLLKKNFRAAEINSSLEPGERRRRIEAFRRGEYEIVYLAPEALEGPLRGILSQCPVSLLVVDEAHCISHWGHDFRPAYRRLRGLKAELGGVPVLALTATATRAVARDVLRELGMKKPAGYKGSFYRPNLKIRVRKKGAVETRREIIPYISARPGASGIVYCLSRKSVERTAADLVARGIRAAAYHAGLPAADRTNRQEAFARGGIQVVVATVAFGMGIDKADVRFVIHRDMPKNVEAWYQEIGRAGRDGEASDCVLYYSWADVKAHERFLRDIEDEEVREATHRGTVELFRLVDRAACRHQALVAALGEEIPPCGASCDVCAPVAEAPAAAVSAEEAAPPRRRRRAAPAGAVRPPAGETIVRSVEGPFDEALFERLRGIRKGLAAGQGVPAYVVFHDSVLRELARRRPKNLGDFAAVPGVGPVKLERYGAIFLEALA